MKYFSRLLMSEKKFIMFYFRNSIFYVKGVGAQKIRTSHQGDLRKIRHVK